ncbi:HotDog domain-containing protein [Cyathus striatus]|nr:HotDog domain-containing protein [Cyathus striatus]
MPHLTSSLARPFSRHVYNTGVCCQGRRHNSSISVRALQDAFRDPSSPFHIPPGETGPASPDEVPLERQRVMSETLVQPNERGLESARDALLAARMDPSSFWEQKIVWGDHDSFQHVNNVRYVRFFESARIQWMVSLGEELGGQSRATAMLKGQGISLILKSIEVQFRRPVTYPDTLLIGYRPLEESLIDSSPDPATFQVAASAYSVAQSAFVAHAKESLVWYDYDSLKKRDPGAEARKVVLGRIQK